MSYVLGIDLGTGSLKGLVVDRLGHILGEESATYQTHSSSMGLSEQEPTDWITALDEVLDRLFKKVPTLNENLKGISFSGQMHSLVLLDKNNQVIRPCILWNDVRTTSQCNWLNEKYNDELFSITQNKALEGFTLPKILWIQENEPNNWAKVDKILLPKDYLSFWLTGKFQTDFSDASGTLLLDMKQKNWSEKLLNEFGIKLTQLPQIKESYDEVGVMKKNYSNKYTLKNQVKVFTGGADNADAALACGVIKETDALLSIGTSGVFLTGQKLKQTNGQIHSFNHVLKDLTYSMGVTLSAGKSLSWFQETFAPNRKISSLLEDTENIQPGSDGLLFTPYIMGERTPYSDSSIRGSFIGIDASHTLPNFTKSVVEGITFSLRQVKELVENQTNQRYDTIISTGGGAKSAKWLQIQADILNATIITLDNEQGPSMGAAMLAAKGLRWFDTDEQLISTFVTYKSTYYPKKEIVKTYDHFYMLYKQIYASTQDICNQLKMNDTKENLYDKLF